MFYIKTTQYEFRFSNREIIKFTTTERIWVKYYFGKITIPYPDFVTFSTHKINSMTLQSLASLKYLHILVHDAK